MVDKVSEELFTPGEWKSLKALAKRRGFKSVRGYVRTLIDNDTAQHGEKPVVMAEDKPGDPVESFRIAWGQAMRGEEMTEEEFWKAVADDA